MKHLLAALVLISTGFGLSAQNPDTQARELVYLHVDRDVYAPSDEINFKAYLNSGSQAESQSTRLSVSLLNAGGIFVANGTFSIAGDQGFGSLSLPDTLQEGEYRMLAYTDRMEKGSPADVYTRRIFIRQYKIPELLISLSADSDWYLPGDRAGLSIHIGLLDKNPYNNGEFSYLATKNGIPYQNGIGKTDGNGDAGLLIRIPQTEEEGIITVAVNAYYKGNEGSASILLPAAGMPVFLNFFPEGGMLIDGLKTKVGFRAQDYQGDPLPFEGVIADQDGQTVGSIKSDPLGIGSFFLLPDQTDPLHVRITSPRGYTKEIPLPEVQQKGVQLILKSRVSGKLFFHVRTNNLHTGEHLLAVAENNGITVASNPLILDDTLSFEVPVAAGTTGIMHVSLLNESGETLAQRPVFFTPPVSTISAVTTGKRRVGDPTNLSLAVAGPDGQPKGANLSVSYSDAAMSPDWSREPDIRSWFLLGPASRGLPPGYFSDPAGMDELMLDNLILTLIDTTLNAKQQHPVEKENNSPSAGFATRLRNTFHAGPFEQFVAQCHRDLFFNEYMLSMEPDLLTFIKSNKGELQKLRIIPGKPTQDDRIRQQLDNGVPVLSIIRSIKPYTMANGQIFFSKGKNSMAYPKGAMIVIDEVPKGFSIDVLSYYSPYDIAGIHLSEKIPDILKYSADASALILITTKNGQTATLPGTGKHASPYNPTLYWNPDIRITPSAPVSLTLPKPALKSARRLVIQGVDQQGNYVHSKLEIPIGGR